MKLEKWTLALAAAGVVSLGSAVQAEEAQNQVMTALSSTTLSGYIDTSANWRFGNNTGALPGRTFDTAAKQDGFNLNAVLLTLEKPMDEGQWSAGYKVDLVFGPDASYYATAPTFPGFGGGDAGDFNVKQAYAALRAPVGNGIDFKMGVFDTVIGYEVFETGNNPNYSRSYGYALEPSHHTGILASYHVNDMISIAGGVANTYNGAINSRVGNAAPPFATIDTQKTFLAAATVTLPENTGIFAGSSIYGGIVDGRGAFNNARDTTSYYAGMTMTTPVQGLAVGAAFDYLEDSNFNLFGTVINPDSWAWAGALYVSYQATEKLKLNARGDWTQGSDGTFYDGGVVGISDNQNELLGLTLTADYALWSSLITRLEGRWDHAIGGDRAFYNGAIPATPDDHNAVTVALNVIYKF
jgi:hypothetical protein